MSVSSKMDLKTLKIHPLMKDHSRDGAGLYRLIHTGLMESKSLSAIYSDFKILERRFKAAFQASDMERKRHS